MADLILLCAGAAPDLAPDTPAAGAIDGPRAAQAIAGGAFARALLRGAVQADSSDRAALPRELPDERWLRARFGVPEAEAIEAWSFRAFENTPPGWRATPVNVQVGHYQLVLTDPAELALTLDEARALGDAARAILADAGFRLRVESPGCWFLEGNDDWDLATHGWTMAVGRSIDGYLPAGGRERDWRRVFTDVQIAWHEHEVNTAREAAGKRPVNALWLDGRAHGPLPPGRARVVTRDTALAGLAIGAGCGLESLAPSSVQSFAPAAEGDLIVDADFWRGARRAGDAAAWIDGWIAFDRWIAQAGLAHGVPRGFEALRVVLSAERRLVELVVRRAQRWQPWRRFDALRAVLAAARPADR